MFANPVLSLFCIIATLAMGLGAHYLLPKFAPGFNVMWQEFAIGSAVIVLALVPLTNIVGSKIARNSAVGGYVQFLNGSIIAASSHTDTCTEDGVCSHTYDCDPHYVTEYYTEDETYYTTESDGKGGTTSVAHTRSVQKSRQVLKYHSCPYATHETDFWLDDSLGDRHVIATAWFDANAERFRSHVGLPSGVGRGIPDRWAAAKSHLEAGDADPVTKTGTYVNFLLASSDSILKAHSADIAKYRKAKLLPDHTRNIHSHPIYNDMTADKVAFIGSGFTNQSAWQDDVSRFNAELGSTLRGDLHVVVVPDSRVSTADSESYANALVAYWQGKSYGKAALAKNTIVLVLGVDDAHQTVTWSRAKTGIPLGNGSMIAALSDLGGKTFSPDTLIGRPKASVSDGKVTYQESSGLVEQIMLTEFPFLRPCMQCKDKGEHGGFVYLKDEIMISTGAKVGIFFADLFFAGLIWVLFAYLPLFEKGTEYVSNMRQQFSNRFSSSY